MFVEFNDLNLNPHENGYHLKLNNVLLNGNSIHHFLFSKIFLTKFELFPEEIENYLFYFHFL